MMRFPPEKVVEIIKDSCGKQFDPKLIDVFDTMADHAAIAELPQEKLKIHASSI